MSNLCITNVRLPPPFLQPTGATDNFDKTWTVKISDGVVIDVYQTDGSEQGVSVVHNAQIFDARGSIMLPSLCHSHIHLDKCFILDSCGDLAKGDFNEAMTVTAKAKETFPTHTDDLYQRGEKLIEESVENGVTSMRAHVEVDTIVGFSCLEVALKLKAQYKNVCDVQIAVFAQEALFQNASDGEPGNNYDLICRAMAKKGVSAIGSAPYVEPTVEQAKKNIGLIFKAAMDHQNAPSRTLRHIDFHLDYNLDPAAEPLIYEVIAQAKLYYGSRGSGYFAEHNIDSIKVDDLNLGGIRHQQELTAGPLPTNIDRWPCITIGHATRLQLFSPTEWRALSAAIADLPITIVGLPQSDMYIQGRIHQNEPLGPPRGTLRVPFIEREYGVKVAMAVNNVDNAFTPQGTMDPLSSLVSFGVAVFQAAAPSDIRTLIEAVTLTSKRAIAFEPETENGGSDSDAQGSQTRKRRTIPTGLFPTPGDPADFVVLHGNESLRSAALHPAFERTTIKDGRVVARRKKWRWISGKEGSLEATVRLGGE